MEITIAKPREKAESSFPEMVKIGRSEYIVERNFDSSRTVTDAVYELLRVDDALNGADVSRKLE